MFPEIVLPNGYIYQDHKYQYQQDFHDSGAKWRWMGGAVGGGKSVTGIAEAIKHSWMYDDNYGLILRKTFPELRISAMKDFQGICPPWMIVGQNRQEHWIDLINKTGYEQVYNVGNNRFLKKRRLREKLEAVRGISRVEFISFEGTLQAQSKFRSANIGWYMVEQAEEASLDIYHLLNERLRRDPSGRQAWFISNPRGHDWLWKLFHPDSLTRAQGHEFFHVRTSDNTALPDDYEDALRATYSEEQADRLLEGDFDVSTDAIFPEFNVDLHTIDHIEPLRDWEKAIGLDHGLNNPTAAVFAARLPTGEIYIYDEYYEKDKLVSDHAQALKPRITSTHLCRMIDPTTRNREPIAGATVMGEYARHGLHFTPSSNDVQAGINRIKEYLKMVDDKEHPFTGQKGSPNMIISKKCQMLIDELIGYEKEPLKTGIGSSNQPEKPRKYNDHAVDAARFMMMGFAKPMSAASKVEDMPKFQFLNADPMKGVKVDDDGEVTLTIDYMIKQASRLKPRIGI